MTASLVERRPGVVLPRLQFSTVESAARTVLRLAASGNSIPAIVDDHGALIWEYPGGDPSAEPARRAITRLRALAGEP